MLMARKESVKSLNIKQIEGNLPRQALESSLLGLCLIIIHIYVFIYKNIYYMMNSPGIYL